MQVTKTTKKKSSFFKKLKRMHKSMSKPNLKQWFKGTIGVFVGAIVMALCVSAFDSVFTALVGLFLG